MNIILSISTIATFFDSFLRDATADIIIEKFTSGCVTRASFPEIPDDLLSIVRYKYPYFSFLIKGWFIIKN